MSLVGPTTGREDGIANNAFSSFSSDINLVVVVVVCLMDFWEDDFFCHLTVPI